MSQEFHLYACIFRIHRFDSKFLGTDDLNLFIFFIILVQILFLEVCSCLLFINDFIFVFTKLTFDDFFNQVNGYIHIIAYLFGSDDISFHRDRYFDFLSFFFDT